MYVRLVSSWALALVLAAAGVGQDVPPEAAPRRVASLFEAARAGDAEAAVKAAEAVVACGDAAVAAITQGLASREAPEILWGLRCLRVLHANVEAGLLRSFLDHQDAGVRVEAVVAGSRLLGGEFGPDLERAASDEDGQVRRRAIDGLRTTRSCTPATLQIAVDGVASADYWVADTCIKILAAWPKPAGAEPDPLLLEAGKVLPRLTPLAGRMVFRTLVARSGPAVEPLIAEVCSRRLAGAAAGAFEAAEVLGLDAVLPDARRLVAAPEPELARPALAFLVARKDRQVVAELVNLLASAREDGWREDLAVGLRAITNQLHGYDVAAWRAYLRDRPSR